MPAQLIQASYAGGEVSPELFARVDLSKYGVSGALMRNVFIDYRGGVSNRGGSQIVGPCHHFSHGKRPRNIPFRFNDEQTYILELGDQLMRVVDRGSYVTKTVKNISAITQANPPVVTANAHGVTAGQYFYINGVVGMLRSNGISGLNGRIFKAASVTTNTITLADPFGFALSSAGWTAYSSGGTVAEIYTVATPWASDILFELKYEQSGDVLTVTHTTVPPYNVSRLALNNWTVAAEEFGPQLAPPTGVTATDFHNDDDTDAEYIYRYVVTAVNTDTDDESAASLVASCINYALNPLAIEENDLRINTITWNAVSGANLYRIYKTQWVPLDAPGGGAPYPWGLIGETSGLAYRDLNYAPDFTQSPPRLNNPFSNGIIESVAIANAGFGYRNPVVVITDSNPAASGASITATINSAGTVTGFIVVNGGVNYTTPTIQVNESGYSPGSGGALSFSGSWTSLGGGVSRPANGSITISNQGNNYHAPSVALTLTGCAGGVQTAGEGHFVINSSGKLVTLVVDTYPTTTNTSSCSLNAVIQDHRPNDVDAPTGALATGTATMGVDVNPECVAYFQQRKAYGGGTAPRIFNMTRPGLFRSFDYSFPSQENDAISGFIVGRDVNAIRSFVAVQSGLIAFTTSGAYLISGGGDNAAITPLNVSAQPQFSTGAAPLQPIVIGADVIFLQARGTGVRSLAYDFAVDSYTGNELSALASHLLKGADITQWCWSEEPHHLVWAVRDDGILLSCAYIKDQQVAGWTRNDTQGLYASVATIPEGAVDAVYQIVRRNINGAYYYVQERMSSRVIEGNPARNIPADPESPWIVDSGARYPLTYPNAQLLFNSAASQSVIISGTVVAGGTGYPSSPQVTVVDPTGTGAVVSATVSGGAVQSVSIINGGQNYSAPKLAISGGVGAIVSLTVQSLMTFDLSAAVVASPTNVGDVLRFPGGRGVVTSVPTTSRIVCDMRTPIYATMPNGGVMEYPPLIAEVGGWSLTKPVSVIGGLDHLTGKYIMGLADGFVIGPLLVADGCVALPFPATYITLGLPYSSQILTLPIDAGGYPQTIQGRRKRIPKAALRAMDTRGVRVGPSFDKLLPIKERTTEAIGAPTRLQDGGNALAPTYTNGPSFIDPLRYPDRELLLESSWNMRGQLAILQDLPLPMTVLATIVALEVGDDPE